MKKAKGIKKKQEEYVVEQAPPNNFWCPPAIISEASDSRTKPETAFGPLEKYPNLDNFATPFVSCDNNRFIDARRAIGLCNKAYWAFPLLRNIVELQAELANAKILLKGGNKKTRDLVESWFKKFDIYSLNDWSFRELFRSNNLFIYAKEEELSDEARKEMTQVYGSEATKKIPVKFIVLNPEQITSAGHFNFENPQYYKVLTAYEASFIKKQKKDSPAPTSNGKRKISDMSNQNFVIDFAVGRDSFIELDPEKLSVLLYKAQPYEPMAIPQCYGALDDIEAKLEMKRIDMSMMRTLDRALLHITVGETPTEHTKGANINPNLISSLQNLFSNAGISRTLVTDYTVKADWKIPSIENILGPAKYEQLDKDIKQALNAIIFDSSEKFANTSIKVQLFVERLKDARQFFLQRFLQPQIIKFCKAMGAKNYPTAYFEELSMKDELQYSKLYLSLAQLGFLTAEELFEAMDSGKLPEMIDSIEHQEEFLKLKEKGYYAPIVGGSTEIQKGQLDIQQQQVDNDALAVPLTSKAPKKSGRPSGTKSPQSSKKVKPMGKSKGGLTFDKLKETVLSASELQNTVDKQLLKKFKLKSLDENQQSAAKLIVESIMANETKNTWISKSKEYVSNPKDIYPEIQTEIDDLQIEYNLDSYTAGIYRLLMEE